MAEPRHSALIVVMGVSGSGKSTVGHALAQRLGWPFLEADELHPAGNLEKMTRGEALTDKDRKPWLESINAWMKLHDRAVIACSALKRRYRDQLRSGLGVRVVFVHLQATDEELMRRLAARKGHFMQPRMLPGQLAALELLEPGEDGVSVPSDVPLGELVSAVWPPAGR